ncbi:unnamed protein product, partial [Thlaspi arvense]
RKRMVLNGYLSVEFDIKSPANEFFQTYIEIMDLPKANAMVKTEVIAFGKKKTTYRMCGFHISEWYKTLRGTIDKATWQNPDFYRKLEGTMTVTHVEDNDRDRATLTVEYEKTRPDIEDPKSIMDTIVDFFKELDKYLLESLK